MAKQTGVISFTGKLGQVVGAAGQDGRNILRVRRYSIKNPRTDAQCAQRMICTTAAQAVAALKEILSNSFEGKSFGAKSIQHARSLYMKMLRTAPSLADNGMVYLPKGSLNFPVNAYILAQGSLPVPEYSYDGADGLIIQKEATATLAALTASKAFPSIAVGNQITILVALENGGKTSVQYCRFAFKDDTTPAFIQDGENPNSYLLNPAAIDTSLAEGKWNEIQFIFTLEQTHINPDLEAWVGASVVGVSVIVSDKVNNKRADAVLHLNENALERGGVDAAEAMPTYADGGQALNVQSDYYLQNSVN